MICNRIVANPGGATAVLTGGSAAIYYALDRYQSRDSDFEITMVNDTQAAALAL